MTVPGASLVDDEGVHAGVGGRLRAHVDGLEAELATIGATSTVLSDAIRGMVSGGKRLRAAFCYWSWRANGGRSEAEPGQTASRETVLATGAALELFQAAALFHDDVMDDSDTRRGAPAAHRAFEHMHAANGWAGSPARFGESAAILLGDLALIASEREFAVAVTGLAMDVRERAQAVYDRMRTEVTVGQYLDVLAQAVPWGTDPAADVGRAWEVVRAKSARYSVEHPLVLGAVLAGADDDALSLCRDVGLPIGEAFQLRDDLLGVFGDPATTGKPAGDDLREGKRTVLVSLALERAEPPDRRLLLEALGQRGLTGSDIEDLRSVLVRTGAVDAVEELIRARCEPALDRLAGAPLTEPGRSMLLALGRAAVDRRS